MPFLKLQGQGSLKFHISVWCHERQLFFIFSLKALYMLWTKRAHQNEILRLFGGWVKIHQILHVILETTN